MHKKALFYFVLICSFPFAIITYQAISSGDVHLAPKEEDNKQLTIADQSKKTPVDLSRQDLIIKPNQNKKTHERTITIANKITKKMISYTKCFVSYTPDFALMINDQIVKPGHTQKITVTDNTLVVTYSYNFLNGYKKGKQSVSFEIAPNQDLYEITFSWQNDWRLMIAQATPKKVDTII